MFCSWIFFSLTSSSLRQHTVRGYNKCPYVYLKSVILVELTPVSQKSANQWYRWIIKKLWTDVLTNEKSLWLRHFDCSRICKFFGYKLVTTLVKLHASVITSFRLISHLLIFWLQIGYNFMVELHIRISKIAPLRRLCLLASQ